MANGLVARRISDYPAGIPEPLCAMERWPVTNSTYELVYLVPTDQVD